MGNFFIINSNELSVLAQVCANITKSKPLADPFAKEQILVYHQGMMVYLSQQIAKENGIESCFEYKQVWQLIFEIFRKIYKNASSDNFYDILHMSLNILSQKEVWNDKNNTIFAKLQSYIKDDKDDTKTYMICSKIADVLDQYQMYRPHWINSIRDLTEQDFEEYNQFKTGKIDKFFYTISNGDLNIRRNLDDNLWQFKLFNILKNGFDFTYAFNGESLESQSGLAGLDRCAVLNAIITNLSKDVLPQRIFLFGVNSLPKLVIDFLQAASQYIEVYVMLLNPCMEYWGDIKDSQKEEFEKFKQLVQHKDLDTKYTNKLKLLKTKTSSLQESYYDNGELVEGNPLLLSLGIQGRDNQYLLIQDCDPMPSFIDAFVDNGTGTEEDSVLTSIQHNLLHLTYSNEHKHVVKADDFSVQIHSCHTIQRELEILKDAILARFKQDANSNEGKLSPRDIVIMVPSINTYAPYINAVFGNSDNDNYIPYAISDRSQQEKSLVVNSVLNLLTVYKEKISNVFVMELLSIPSIAKKFQISADEVLLIERWLKDNNIHWGLDDEDTQKVCKFKLKSTFESGLNRMIYGVMSGVEDDFASYTQIEGRDAILLGKLCHFIDELNHLRKLFIPNLVKEPSEWCILLQENILQKFYLESECFEQLQTIGHVILKLQQACEVLITQPKITLAVFFNFLRDYLKTSKDFSPYLRGKLNFCSLMPMRAIPFKHIYILGLNDLDFPRRDDTPSFNLMYLPSMRKRGDRSQSIDDKYLFLESIMAAKQSLYLSYIGQSPINNTKSNPSIVVTELLDYLNANFTVHADGSDSSYEEIYARFVTEHRLLAYDVHNYIKDNKPFSSFDKANFIKLEAKDLFVEKFIGNNQNYVLEDKNEYIIDLKDLIRFLTKPVEQFLRQKFALNLNDYDKERLESDEPFSLSTLQENILVSNLINKDQNGAEHYLDFIDSNAQLPVAVLGDDLKQTLKSRYHNFYTTYNAILADNKQQQIIIEKFDPEFDLINAKGEKVKVYLNAKLDLPIIDLGICSKNAHTSYKYLLNVLLQQALYYCYKDELANAYIIDTNMEAKVVPVNKANLASIKDKYKSFLKDMLSFYIKGQTMALPIFSNAIDKVISVIEKDATEADVLQALQDKVKDFGYYDEHCKMVFKDVKNIFKNSELSAILIDFCMKFANLYEAVAVSESSKTKNTNKGK